MAVPGVWEENELKLLLKKLINSKDEVFKFAVAAKGPREGQLALDKKLKFKKKDVQEKAESDAKEEGGKPVKMEVMTGECRLDSKNNTTLLLLVNGKAPAKAVACIEHLLVRGPFKAIGFTGVILEEVDENVESSTTESPSGESESSGSESESPSSETESSSSESVTDAPSDEQAKWEKALADIEPSYLQGLSDRPGDASQFRAVMGFAQGKAETKDYKAAIAALQKLAELLKGKPKTEGTTADDPSALFNERLKALLPQIKAAAGTPAGDEAKLKASEAGVFGRKKDFLQANALLDLAEAALKRGDAQKQPQPTAGPDKANLVESMAKLGPNIKAALGINPALKADFADQIAAFEALLERGELGEARELLMSLAMLVKGVIERKGDTAGNAGKVDFEKIHLDWDSRKSEVESRLKELNKAITDDWEDPTAMTAAANLSKVLARFNEGLGDTLDALRNAVDAEKRSQLATKATGIADRYLDYLATDALVAHVEDNPFEITVGARETLSTPLNELRDKLSKMTAGSTV